MNFFSNDLSQGLINMMGGNKWNAGSEKEMNLKKILETCTYPDETKYMIEKAVKQVFHVYPFFNPDLLMFTEGGYPKRYIELRGILEVEIKGKTCKVDFNMMLPAEFPRAAPFVRIVNRNPDYKVDPFYNGLQSKTDPSSYVLNEKLTTVKGWHQSNSLVNVVIECNDLFKNRFPFSKPVTENSSYNGGSSNAWDTLYNKKNPPPAVNPVNNYGGGGFVNNNNNWGAPNVPASGWNANNNNNWGANNNNGWGNNNLSSPNVNNGGWNNNNSNGAWGANTGGNAGGWGANNNNNWGAPNNPPIGGMSGLINGGNNAANFTNNIASAQKLVGKQKVSLEKINASYVKVIEKNQQLDVMRQSLSSEETYLRKENFEMSNFLKTNESQPNLDMSNLVQPKDALSEQILDLLSSLKAREECVGFIETRFNQEVISLEDFMKQLRKVEEARFEEKCLLQKCLKHAT